MKKIPLRRCIGCFESKPKNELYRIVKTAEGEILLDKTGKKNGRGAYICSNKECLERAIKGKKLENIKGQISPITQVIEGCKFNPRCNFVMDKCKIEKPELKNCNNSYCACFLFDQ